MRQLLLIGVIFLVWWQTINQSLWGDGFYFFEPYNRTLFSRGKFVYGAYNIGSKIMHSLLIPVFKDNMSLYFIFQLALLSLLTVLIYHLALRLTQDKLISLSTGILFSTSFINVFEMMAEGQLNRFLDRVPNFIFTIISAILLVKYIHTKKNYVLVSSLVFYAIGIFFGHYATFFLSFFVFFPIVFLFDPQKKFASLLAGLLIAILFIATNFSITRKSDQKSDYFSVLLDPRKQILEKTFYQVITLAVPPSFPKFIVRHWPDKSLVYPFIEITKFLTVAGLALTIFIGKLIYQKDKNLFRLYLVCVLSIYATTAIMITTDPFRFDPFKRFEGGRQMFIQSILFSLAVAIALDTLLKKIRKPVLLYTSIFLVLSVAYNARLIDHEIYVNQYKYNGMKKYLSYVKSIWPQFTSDAVLILVSPHLISASSYLNSMYGPPKIKYVTDPKDFPPVLSLPKKNVFVIDYDYEQTPDGYFLPDLGKVVDLTQPFRLGKLHLLGESVKPGSYLLEK